MKTQLMASDIIPYLPNKLKVLSTKNNIYSLIGIKDEICYLSNLTYPCDISDIKPILRPMKDVYRPYIDDAGKSFIPAKLLWSCDAKEEEAFDLYGTIPAYWKACLDVTTYDLEYRTIQLLLEMHFDIFGLINEKLAVDYNKISP